MKERIKIVYKDSKLNQADFAEKIGISRSGFQKIIHGDNGASEQTIRGICSEFGISRRWLETGEGEMYEENDSLSPREVQMMLRGSFSDEQIAWAITMLQQPTEVLQGMTQMLRDYAEELNKIKRNRE